MTASENQTTPPAEQRRTTRVPLLVLRVAVRDEQRTFFGYAKNLSRSGIFIATISPREVGSEFEIELPLPNPLGFPLRCRARVAWTRKFDQTSPYEPGMGMTFIDLDAASTEQLAAWVARETA